MQEIIYIYIFLEKIINDILDEYNHTLLKTYANKFCKPIYEIYNEISNEFSEEFQTELKII